METIMSCIEDTSIQLCRLCLRNTTGCISILTEYFDADVYELPKIVKNCVGVEVQQGDGFTCMICGPCHKMVLRFNSFKATCLESQWRLRNMPRWASQGPRDPLDGCEEGQSAEGTPAEKEMVVLDPSPEMTTVDGVSNGERRGGIWPVAMWTMSEGCWRARTCNSDETIVSDLLDNDEEKSMDVDNRDEGKSNASGDTTLSADEDLSMGTQDMSYEEHNYSSQLLSAEPLQLCSVVMEQGADEEEVQEGHREEEEPPQPSVVIIGQKKVGVVKKFNQSAQEPPVVQAVKTVKLRSPPPSAVRTKLIDVAVLPPSPLTEAGNPSPVTPIHLKPREILPKPNGSSDIRSMVQGCVATAKVGNSHIRLRNDMTNIVPRIVIKKKSIASDPGKIGNGQMRLKNDMMNLVPKIVIKKDTKCGLGKVRVLRLAPNMAIPEGSRCTLLQVKKVVR